MVDTDDTRWTKNNARGMALVPHRLANNIIPEENQ